MQELVLALAEVSSSSRGAQYHTNATFSRRYEHHPTYQLPAPVVADDSGRREGEPPLVPDDVAPVVKEANVDDDMEDDDDDPDKYFNTAYDDGGLMAQDDEDSGYERGDDDLMLPDLPEPERPKAECKKSLFKRTSRETPQMPPVPSNPPRPVH